MSTPPPIEGSVEKKYQAGQTYDTQYDRARRGVLLTAERRYKYNEKMELEYEYEFFMLGPGNPFQIPDLIECQGVQYLVDVDATLGWRIRHYLQEKEVGHHTSAHFWYKLQNGQWYYRSKDYVAQNPDKEAL